MISLLTSAKTTAAVNQKYAKRLEKEYMADIKLTLQNRITSLMVVSTVILISVFTLIQLNNHLSNLTLYNSYQARLSSLLAKNSLEETLKSLPAGNVAAGPYLQKTLDSLTEIRIVDKAVIIDGQDTVIAATDNSLIGKPASTKDMVTRYNIATRQDKNKLFELEIDKVNRVLNIFIPLKNPGGTQDDFLLKLTSSIGNIREALIGVYKPVILTSALVVFANIIIGFMLSKIVIGPIKILNEATKVIASGKLETRVAINTDDELEELADTFNDMAKALIKMKERAENANPLTKLPGNIIIREEVEKRIQRSEKFMVIHSDLNNFKAFNDSYGYAKGDEVIKLTSQILRESLEKKGNPQDILGHEGGDDFVLITTLAKSEEVCSYIISEFDKRVREFYNAQDLERGFIIAEARQGGIMKFPIMCISLSGVDNEHRDIKSFTEVTNIDVEMKKKVKAQGKSFFAYDQRK